MPIVGVFFETTYRLGASPTWPWQIWNSSHEMLIQLIYVSYYVLLMVILLPMIHSHTHFLWLLYISYGFYMLPMIYSHIKKILLQDTCRWRVKTPAGNLKCRVLPIFSWALSSSFAPMGSSLQFVGMELKNIYKHHERTARYYLPGTCSTLLPCRFFKPQG